MNINSHSKYQMVEFFLYLSVPGILLIPLCLNPLVPGLKLSFSYLFSSLINTLISVCLGVFLAPKALLKTGFFEKEAPTSTNLKWGILFGFLASFILFAGDFLIPAKLPQPFEPTIKLLLLLLPAKLLYGAVNEELLLRFGMMTLFTWFNFDYSKSRESNKNVYILAIILSAALFAVGHLPALFTLETTATIFSLLVVKVLLLNMAGGLIFGYLYWKHNLLTAMVSHGFCHIFLTIAWIFQLYFLPAYA